MFNILLKKEGAGKGNLIGYYIIAFLSQNENEGLTPEIRLLTNALSHLLAQQWHHCWWITTNLHFLKIRLSVKKRAVTQFHNCRIWQKCIVQNRFIIAIPLIRNQQMFRIAEFTCFPHKIESDFARTGQTTLNWNSSLLENIMNRTYPSAFLLVHWELLFLHRLQLVPEVELGSLIEKIRWSSFFERLLQTFFCSLANLFSYLETFFSVGLMLQLWSCHLSFWDQNGLFDRNVVS